MNRIRVVLADDHRLLLQAIRGVLEKQFEVVAVATSGDEMLRAIAAHDVDVAVADIFMPGMNGMEAARAALELQPDLRLIFLTMHEDPTLAAEAFRIGACGYVLKSNTANELVQAIREAAAGGRFLSASIAGGDLRKLDRFPPSPVTSLTPREREVVRLIAAGDTMPEVASRLGITPRTVAFHKYRAMEKLGAVNTAELIKLALDHRIQ